MGNPTCTLTIINNFTDSALELTVIQTICCDAPQVNDKITISPNGGTGSTIYAKVSAERCDGTQGYMNFKIVRVTDGFELGGQIWDFDSEGSLESSYPSPTNWSNKLTGKTWEINPPNA